MTDSFGEKLNFLLSAAFESMLKIEEQTLKSAKRGDLSISEVHVIEAIGDGGGAEGVRAGDIARELEITPASVTAAVNKLEKKGYVQKGRSPEDGRAVHVTLAGAGKKIYSAHRYFHRKLARMVSGDYSEKEKEILLDGLEKLNKFLQRALNSGDKAFSSAKGQS